MHTELACLHEDLSSVEVEKSIFAAVQHKVNNIILPPSYLPLAAQVIQPNQHLGTVIDFPNGNMPTEVRRNAIVSVSKRHTFWVDLVYPPRCITEREYRKIEQDLTKCIRVADNVGVKIRALVNHRVVEESHLIDFCHVLVNSGVNHIVCGTGTTVDDWLDTTLTGYQVAKSTKIKPIICTTNILDPDKLDQIRSSGVFGIRFHSVVALERASGV